MRPTVSIFIQVPYWFIILIPALETLNVKFKCCLRKKILPPKINTMFYVLTCVGSRIESNNFFLSVCQPHSVSERLDRKFWHDQTCLYAESLRSCRFRIGPFLRWFPQWAIFYLLFLLSYLENQLNNKLKYQRKNKSN